MKTKLTNHNRSNSNSLPTPSRYSEGRKAGLNDGQELRVVSCWPIFKITAQDISGAMRMIMIIMMIVIRVSLTIV